MAQHIHYTAYHTGRHKRGETWHTSEVTVHDTADNMAHKIVHGTSHDTVNQELDGINKQCVPHALKDIAPSDTDMCRYNLMRIILMILLKH